jgi:RNA polymerase sigma-B factor
MSLEIEHEEILEHGRSPERRSMTAAVSPLQQGEAGEEPSDYIDIDSLYSRVEKAETPEESKYWRRRIAEKAMPLADHIARRFLNRGETREDLIQVARLALVKAVNRYDASKGQFVSFAVPTILGEIRRHFRDNTWGTHVPRRYQESTLALRTAVDELTQRNGHLPSAQELAAELDMTPEEIRLSEEAQRAYRPLSLDQGQPAGGARPLHSRQSVEDPGYNRVEDMTVLSSLIRELPARERALIQMRFYDCLKQRDIAQRLGVSQVHVSRLLKSTIRQLRLGMCIEGAAMMATIFLAASCFAACPRETL